MTSEDGKVRVFTAKDCRIDQDGVWRTWTTEEMKAALGATGLRAAHAREIEAMFEAGEPE